MVDDVALGGLVRMSDATPRRVEEERIRRAYEGRSGDGRYSWLSPGHQLLMQSAEHGLLAALGRAGMRSLRDPAVLEVGCGTGHWLRALVQWGARPENITGLDLLPDRLAAARHVVAPAVHLLTGSGAMLPFADGAFDVVLQSTVFTSILDDRLRQLVASEMLRVLRPDGVILWYDFLVDNPRNPDVQGVRKREVRRLFPGCRLDFRRVTLAPPLARALAPHSWSAAALLSALPFLCTHYAGTIRRQLI